MFKVLNVTVVTEEMNLKNNHIPLRDFKINPKIQRNTGVLDEAKNKYFTILSVSITSTEEMKLPVNLHVSIRAIFTVQKEAGCEQKHIDRFLRLQGVSILYPYVRSSLSALTGAAGLPPIMLPVVNTVSLFKEDIPWMQEQFGNSNDNNNQHVN
jgi:preprotein translocase subunit SecB